jgi:hypothetical protein
MTARTEMSVQLIRQFCRWRIDLELNDFASGGGVSLAQKEEPAHGISAGFPKTSAIYLAIKVLVVVNT